MAVTPAWLAQLPELRTVAESFMVETAQVIRATETETRTGGHSDGWALTGATLPCHLVPMTHGRAGREALADGRFEITSEFVLYLPAFTDVVASDRLAFVAGGAGATRLAIDAGGFAVAPARTFELKGPPVRSASAEVQRSVIVKELDR